MPDMERTLRKLELHLAETPDARMAVHARHTEIDRKRWKFVAMFAWATFAIAIVAPLLFPA